MIDRALDHLLGVIGTAAIAGGVLLLAVVGVSFAAVAGPILGVVALLARRRSAGLRDVERMAARQAATCRLFVAADEIRGRQLSASERLSLLELVERDR